MTSGMSSKSRRKAKKRTQLARQQRNVDKRGRHEITAHASWSGPLPPPQMLAQFEDICLGAAKLIIDRFGKQSDHRMSLEKSVIENDIKQSKLGMWLGFIICTVTIITGGIVAFSGQGTAGATIATVAVVGLATVFVYGNKSRKEERSQRN